MNDERSGAWRLCLALFCAGWAAGCGPEEAATPNEPSGETTAENWLSELPEPDPSTGIVAEEMRTIEVTEELQQAGQAFYAQSCVPCHGAEGEGRLGTGPQLNSDTFLAAASDDFLVRTIGRGRQGTTMPGWGRTYDRSEVESIVAYMRGWGEVEAVELDEDPNEGDAEAGAVTFREICAACHGVHGGGYQETSNGTGIGRSAFLADASNGYLRYIIEHGKADTPMRPFGRPEATAVANLTTEQIENVIAHLRSSAW